MKELSDIVQAWMRAEAHGLRTALATVVGVEGSSYRQPGARMLVTETGELTGAISGGCLEGDALRKAQWAIQKQENLLVTYDTTGDDNTVLGAGLGCEGIIHVLIEPVLPENQIMQWLKATTSARQPSVLLTLYRPTQRKGLQTGTIGHFDPVRSDWNGIASEMEPVLRRMAIEAAANRQSIFEPVDDLMAFVQYVPPPLHLVIAGTGMDTLPLVEIASVLGWTVTLLDERARVSQPAYLPVGCPVLSGSPQQLLSGITLDADTAVVLMTHNYAHDKALLRLLLDHDMAYIGMLGPKKKYEKMQDEWENEGFFLENARQKRVFAPVGLDIGAESPEAIAVSIVSEIIAATHGRSGSFLKDRTVPIHVPQI